MKTALLVLRAAGMAVGMWLIVASLLTTPPFLGFSRQTVSSWAWLAWCASIFGAFRPSLLLGVALLLPWSCLRPSSVWWSAFALLLTVSALYLHSLYAPYTYVWRPNVLLETGILQELTAVTVFLVLQLVGLVLLRLRRTPRLA